MKKSADHNKMKAVLPWASRMGQERYSLLKSIVDSPSPVNLEGAMTKGVIEPYLAKLNPKWKVHRFKSSASLVVDSWTRPTPPKLTVMVCFCFREEHKSNAKKGCGPCRQD
jgi:hypothetical protein